LVEPLADPPHARDHCRRRHHRSAAWRGTPCPVADGRRPLGGSTGAVLRGTESLLTHRWRGEAAANPALNRGSDEFLESIKRGVETPISLPPFLVIKIILHNFDLFTGANRRILKN